jgi:hypothetical protein
LKWSSPLEVGSPENWRTGASIKEVVYHIQDLAMRCDASTRSAEMAEVFMRLEEDGISEGTPLHGNATILFKDHVNRE